MINTKIPDTEEAWETRQLGADEAFVAVAEPTDAAIDAALELVTQVDSADIAMQQFMDEALADVDGWIG